MDVEILQGSRKSVGKTLENKTTLRARRRYIPGMIFEEHKISKYLAIFPAIDDAIFTNHSQGTMFAFSHGAIDG